MRYLGALIGSAVGGLVGAAVWAAIGYYASVEAGWIAWGIGAAAGYGALLGSWFRGGVTIGCMAAAVAICAIGLGKLAGGHFDTRRVIESQEVSQQLRPTEEEMVARGAKMQVRWLRTQNVRIGWPAGVNPEDASAEQDFPPEVWATALGRWEGATPAQQEFLRGQVVLERRRLLRQHTREVTVAGALATLGPLDLLWAALAIGSAFAIGRREKRLPVET